ncbi:hypothetical protein BGX29_010489 [Mortierella sp. GBA35]|nr:hypothetical protein BGX29_010489 [Mortierella sp. GBA35]
MGNQTSKKPSPKGSSSRSLGSETDYLSSNSNQPSFQEAAKRDNTSASLTNPAASLNGGPSIEAANGRVQATHSTDNKSHNNTANGNNSNSNSNSNPASSLLGRSSHESTTNQTPPTSLLASLPRARPSSTIETSPVQVNVNVVSGTILPSHNQESSERRLKSSLISSDLIQPPPAAHTQDSTHHLHQQQRHSGQTIVGPSSGLAGQQGNSQNEKNSTTSGGTTAALPDSSTNTTTAAAAINNNNIINNVNNINNNKDSANKASAKDGASNTDSKLRQEHYDHIKNNIFGGGGGGHTNSSGLTNSGYDNESSVPVNGHDDHQQAHQQANGTSKDTQPDQDIDHNHNEQEQGPPSPPPPEPSIPFAVLEPGEPILVKRPHLPPLIIPSSHSSSAARSPPLTKSLELSPTARIPFLGSSGDKNNKAIDIDEMISKLLDAGYSGKIAKNICLRNNEIVYICQQAREVFLSQPTLIELNAPVKIVGDIHGQYTDLLRMFEMCGFPPSANFLFLGDYVDRGKMSLETILLLFCYKIKYPENFFLLRGNHECASVTKVYGFYDECKRRASIKMWKAFVDVFNCLPLAAIVANKIFCVHGGLSPSLGTMDDIRALRRPTDVPDYGLLNDLLWSDPSDTALDWEDNERGVSYCFGRSIIQKFLNKHDFDLICRAHMVVEDGYEFFNDRALVTVFSAPNYCGEFDNFGAVMSVSEELLCSFELLKPIDQATARAQMQSLAATNGGWRVNKQRLSIPDSNSLYGVSQNATINS